MTTSGNLTSLRVYLDAQLQERVKWLQFYESNLMLQELSDQRKLVSEFRGWLAALEEAIAAAAVANEVAPCGPVRALLCE